MTAKYIKVIFSHDTVLFQISQFNIESGLATDIKSFYQFDSDWEIYDHSSKKRFKEVAIKTLPPLYPAYYLLEYLVACYRVSSDRLVQFRCRLKTDDLDFMIGK